MGKHTPDTILSAECGCRVVRGKDPTKPFGSQFNLEQCPTHAAAPELLEACEKLLNLTNHPYITAAIGDLNEKLPAWENAKQAAREVVEHARR